MISCQADLNPLDHSMWGYWKGMGYKGTIRSYEEVLSKISNAAAKISTRMLLKAIRNFRTKSWYCLTMESGYFEHFHQENYMKTLNTIV